ncbi:hypothetical protein [Chromobacterium vaccinii]|uniref:hypothetical protein n=1 Tax=Chromobacterium vaccinii TaxID=1108595 RepID=UPI0034587EF7
MSNNKTLLSVRNLRVSFRQEDGGRFEALKGVSFDIPAHRTRPKAATTGWWIGRPACGGRIFASCT